MTKPFLQHHTLRLTPISPLHLGTGEDYEPTGYVISDGILYAFDPSQAELNAVQRQELAAVAQSTGENAIQNIQRYFKKHADTFRQCAHKAVGVSKALENEYTAKIGQTVQYESKDKRVNNKLLIERTAANPLTHQPYIPGSAFKGSVRTALLDAITRLNPPRSVRSNEATKYENSVLGSFASDIMRLLKAADFMPSETVSTQIQYAVNKKKHAVIKDGKEQTAKGVTGRRETIQHGQYRAFAAECTIQHLLLEHNPRIRQPEKNLPSEKLRPFDLHQAAQAVNAYHLPRWKKENEILAQRNFVDPQWLRSTQALLDSLKTQLDSGKIMLMQLGKNGGAESKTLTNLAQIKIMQGKGQKPAYESQTKTVWLAAQAERETHGLLPFGWALIEIDPQGDNAALKQWCSQNSGHLADTAAIMQKLAQERQEAIERKQAQQAAAEREAAEQAAQAERERQAQAAREAELAAMPPEDRLIAEWRQRLEDFTFDSRNQQAHTEFYQAFSQALQQAADTLDAAAQQKIAEGLAWGKISKQQPNLFAGKREKEIKAILRQLRGE